MKTLTDYLIKSAAACPKNTAIECGSELTSYQDLLNKSFLVAEFISNIDCSNNIVICLPKSRNLYCAIFGVLFAAKCYVPLSYNSPSSRFKYIVHDSASSLIITTYSKLLKNFPEMEGAAQLKNSDPIIVKMFLGGKIEAIYSFEEILNNPSTPSLNVDILAQSPCYLLYTSGSTGKPKGILHTHKSATAFVDWAANNLAISSHDVVAHKSDTCFDLSVFDIFATIKAGAKIVPVPESLFNNGALLVNFVYKSKITILYTVPSTILNHLTVSVLEKIKNSSLRHIIFAGEQLYAKKIEGMYSYLPSSCQLHNWYGPTETNVCFSFRIPLNQVFQTVIPIGQPCCFARALINEDNELLIESETLMVGYWNQANIESPYASGDIICCDNNYYFEGRKDRQAKFNGYRVQPEEIESILAALDGIKDAAVIIDNKNITAFLSFSGNEDITDSNVVSFCKRYLEHYMIPTRIIKLKEIPRSNRNKIEYGILKGLGEGGIC